jgi:hypothetical protein
VLTPDDATDIVRDLWKLREAELLQHDRAYGYVRGVYGVPAVPDGAGDELADIARMAVKNVLAIVVDAFAQNLSVNGFRSPDSDQDDPAWAWWQAQNLDARQQDAHRPALTYGTGYAVLDPERNVRLRTPRQMLAVYADPLVDLWPIYALETWIDYSERKPIRRGRLYDAEAEYELDLGDAIVIGNSDEQRAEAQTRRMTVRDMGQPVEHNAGVCPVVRFVNKRDAEDVVVGEVLPLIRQQKAINAVNFDRLVVSRFGAFPQRYVIGWMAASGDELAKVSMQRLLSFEDAPQDVTVGAFPAASVDGYNSIIEEMLTHVAMEAQIPLSAFGNMANLSADALAMAEAPHQRKLIEKRESFGESWEQLIRLAAEMGGETVADDAEVTWRDSETRSFAQVVDGIVKLNQAGVPIEELLTEIPGWSKQRVDSARAAIRRATGRDVLGDITAAAPDPAEIRAKADAMGVLIRAGVEPASAARQVGLDEVTFTGAVPVSLRLPEQQASRLEGQ